MEIREPANTAGNALDLAGPGHWERVWKGRTLPTPIDPTDAGLHNQVNLMMHEQFVHVLRERTDQDLIEVGCANSPWLPYFHDVFGYDVAGIDYDKLGCDQAEAICLRAGTEAKIVHGDVFSFPNELRENFDVAVSFGVVEHFADTREAIAAIAKLIRPGGLLLTWIPNMTGIIGLMQRLTNAEIYKLHVPLDAEDLRRAHVDAGLRPEQCTYHGVLNFGVCNLIGLSSHSLRTMIKSLFLGALRQLSKMIWFLEKTLNHRFRPNPYTGSYILCVAVKD